MSSDKRIFLHLKSRLTVAAGITDLGLQRRKNEDVIYLEDSGHLYLVADGLGGHERGGQASQTAISRLSEYLEPEEIMKKSQDVTAVAGVPLPLGNYIPVIENAVSEANAIIYSKNKKLRLKKFMGTTIAGLLLMDDYALWFHAGDSRVYRWRNSKLAPITRDHSLYAAWEGNGKNGKAPSRHIITKALGLQRSICPDIGWDGKEKGDIYLLCSDGLTDMVDDDHMEAIIKSGRDKVEEILNALVDAALEAGGKDNISLIVCRVKR